MIDNAKEIFSNLDIQNEQNPLVVFIRWIVPFVLLAIGFQ